ncbi:hypothetical protein B9Z55_024154 [Caenorhabditis nigoni]|uniref:Uncharacterized protein n=1 Tax=Caenorhabditis nigoni TaxID=1611254 RepID=A0A2G5SSZ9_9PELO|nr:hypothetical protein B9Z55_024154 [Caenorhabditis nigoni]
MESICWFGLPANERFDLPTNVLMIIIIIVAYILHSTLSLFFLIYTPTVAPWCLGCSIGRQWWIEISGRKKRANAKKEHESKGKPTRDNVDLPSAGFSEETVMSGSLLILTTLGPLSLERI